MIENPLPSAPDSVKEKFYDDVIHPAAKQVGYIAETIVMAVNKKLEPIRQWATYGKENNEKLECEIQKHLANIARKHHFSSKRSSRTRDHCKLVYRQRYSTFIICESSSQSNG